MFWYGRPALAQGLVGASAATSVSRLSNVEVRAVLLFLLKCERKDDDALTR
jgi:hypothetical protein